MNDFIDFEGASGAVYRFRLWPAGAPHQPVAGNYICLRSEDGGPTVVSVGASMDLSRVREQLPPRVRAATSHIYTRLNVARATRSAEHADLTARYATAKARVRVG